MGPYTLNLDAESRGVLPDLGCALIRAAAMRDDDGLPAKLRARIGRLVERTRKTASQLALETFSGRLSERDSDDKRGELALRLFRLCERVHRTALDSDLLDARKRRAGVQRWLGWIGDSMPHRHELAQFDPGYRPLTPAYRNVYLFIAKHAAERGRPGSIAVSRSYIAKRLHMDVKTVGRAVERLETMGLLVVSRGRRKGSLENRVNVYAFGLDVHRDWVQALSRRLAPTPKPTAGTQTEEAKGGGDSPVPETFGHKLVATQDSDNETRRIADDNCRTKARREGGAVEKASKSRPQASQRRSQGLPGRQAVSPANSGASVPLDDESARLIFRAAFDELDQEVPDGDMDEQIATVLELRDRALPDFRPQVWEWAVREVGIKKAALAVLSTLVTMRIRLEPGRAPRPDNQRRRIRNPYGYFAGMIRKGPEGCRPELTLAALAETKRVHDLTLAAAAEARRHLAITKTELVT